MTEEQLLDANEPAGLSKRPAFLTVLCILTWVGCAVLLFFSWLQYDMAVGLRQNMKEFARLISEAGGGYHVDRMAAFYNNMILIAYVQAATCLVCTVGAVFIWRLRRIGFYLYAFGELASLIGFCWFAWRMSQAHVGGLEVLVYVILALFPAAFLVMYGLNLKHLRR